MRNIRYNNINELKNNVDKKKKLINKNKSKNKNNEFKGIETMQKIFKKNQLVIVSLALMLITAGYMNYNNSANEINMSLAELGDAKLVGTNVYSEVSSENVLNNEQDNNTFIENNQNQDNNAENNVANEETNEISTSIENHVIDETTQTNSDIEKNEINNTQVSNDNIDTKDYFVQTRLDRDTMYSQMLETYQKILENEKVPNDQKGIASNEIKNINARKSALSIAENLIKTKGFDDVVILINDNSINVVVKQKDNLKEEQVAQITNIVSRELKAEIADIHISVHK